MPAPKDPDVDEPRWLTDDQLAAWRGFMKLLQRLPAALEAQLQQDSKLSLLEYHVLAHLSDQPGRRMRLSELATLATTELSRLSHLIGRLESRGFVHREPDPGNGRYTLAVLTEAGYAHLVGAAPAHVERVLTLFVDVLTPRELQTLHRISGKVLDRIDSGPTTASNGPAEPCAT